jgi:hypothetical protein
LYQWILLFLNIRDTLLLLEGAAAVGGLQGGANAWTGLVRVRLGGGVGAWGMMFVLLCRVHVRTCVSVWVYFVVCTHLTHTRAQRSVEQHFPAAVRSDHQPGGV